nr:hypothetical protein [uncultured Fusobacterium sp.]
MKILVKKLFNIIGEKKLKERIGETQMKRLKNENYKFSFYVLCKKIDVEQELSYTFEEFIADFKDTLKKFNEPKLVYKIWKQGESLSRYAKKHGISQNTIYRATKKGRKSLGENFKYQLLDSFEITVEIDDIKNFRLELHDEFAKLFGDKTELENLANKYEIDYPVLYYNNEYSIAFDGWFYRYLVDYYKKNK